MISRVDEWIATLEDWKEARLEASGYILENAIKDSIRDKGLIDQGRMINDVRHDVDGDVVRVGTTLNNPNYPLFLNNGFRHYISGEIVGPYRFMESGASNAEGELRMLWGAPIRGL